MGENEHVNTDVYLSPWLASDEQLRALPKIFMIAATYDPLLDDAVCGKNSTAIPLLPGYFHMALCHADRSCICDE